MDNQASGSNATGGTTGTRDNTYNLTAVLYHALQGVENCQIYMNHASGKQEHRQFFQMAADQQRQLAEQAKRLLHDALMQETGGGLAGGQQSVGGQASAAANSGHITGESHSFEDAKNDDSAFRFASSETEGGSDQFAGGSDMARQGGSAYTSGQSTGSTQNDQSEGQYGQSALGQGQRHTEMTTGGGGTSSF